MVWTPPKTDWKANDEPLPEDFNAIGNNLLHLAASIVPQGVIVMWSGTLASIPAGWALCDGNNGTPDLRDRFILGVAAGEAPGATGGSHTKKLTEGELPGHTHTFTSGSAGSHTHTGKTGIQSSGHTHNLTTDSAGSHTHTISTASHTHTYRKTQLKLAFGAGSYGGERDADESATTSSHSHKHTAGSAGSHTHTGTTSAPSVDHTHNFTTGSAGGHTHTGTSDAAGQGASFDIRPKYYKLAFLMKL